MTYAVQDFQKEVIQRSFEKPVLVDFWAEWCGPCKVLGPVLERLAVASEEQWAFVKVDTETHRELAMQYGIRGIPNVKLFVDGKVKDEFTGALPEPMIRQWLDKALPGKFQGKIARVYKLLAQDQVAEAEKLLNEVVRAEPGNTEARGLLAKVLLFSQPETAERLARELQGSDQHDLAETLGRFTQLFQRLEKPDDFPDEKIKPKYLQAIRDLKNRDFAAALPHFIEVLELNRYYDEDGARKAIIAIFKFLGEEHDLTRQYRPIFSRALYS